MAAPIPNPLLPAHEAANAELQPYADVQIVSTFGQPQAEYSAIHKSCGMMDLPQRGLIEVTGKDRHTFLNNLLTNQTFNKQTKMAMPPGSGVYAFLLNAKTGRVIVDLNVLELGERTLMELDARLVDLVLQTLDRYRFAEQVSFASPPEALHEIALHGPGASDIVAQSIDRAANQTVPKLTAQISCATAKMLGHDVVLWRDDACGVPGFFLVIPQAAAEEFWQHLLTRFGVEEKLGKRALRPIGWAAFNACRIEAGRPIFGIDFDDSIVPAETGQVHRAGGLTKGCYPGQEIVARMHARQQWAKQLVGIRMDSDALPIAGSPIHDAQGNNLGAITSSTISPILSGAALALGFVRKPFFAIGSRLTIPAEGEMRGATVVKTPFVETSSPITQTATKRND